MGTVFDLPSELNIYNAAQIRDALLAWHNEQVSSTVALQVSAKQVAEVDGAGLQLLAALTNSGKQWRVIDASSVFVDACRILGFSHWVDGLDLAHEKGTP